MLVARLLPEAGKKSSQSCSSCQNVRLSTLETVAVYWEPNIKTYGFKDVLNLSLMALEFPSGQLPQWGLSLYEMDDSGLRFELILTQLKGENVLQLYLLFERKWEDHLIKRINEVIRKDAGETFRITSPVDMVSFLGPHFGERYGIADSVFRVLTPEAISVLVASFSGSIVYLILPAGMAKKAKVLLAGTFEAP